MNLDTTHLPPGLAVLATRLSLDTTGWRAHGRIDLKVDAHPRVTLRRGRGEQIDVEARLARLPLRYADREALLDRLMLRATAGARARTATLVLSADGEQLLLQAALADGGVHAVHDGLEGFLNDLDYWNAVMKERV